GRVRHVAGLLVDSDLLLAGRNGEHVRLTPLEHDLLVCLGSEPRQTWTHAALHEAVWNTRHVGGQADIHSVVKRLRRKLAELGSGATITAVRGVGFRLSECPSAGPAGVADHAEADHAGAGRADRAGAGLDRAGAGQVGRAGAVWVDRPGDPGAGQAAADLLWQG
ncbi:MAG: winged helix-turn-helix domain-containing protein, partial [Natronosporangium sp.]